MNNADKLLQLMADFHKSEQALSKFLESIGEPVYVSGGAKATAAMLIKNAQRKLDTYRNLDKEYEGK